MSWNNFVYLLLRAGLGSVFVCSGILKLMDISGFVVVVQAFSILPSAWGYPFAFFLPVFEVVAGLGLVFGVRGALSAVMLMLGAFICVLVYAIYMGYDIDCGCFGPEDPEAGVFSSLKTSLVRDLVFVLLGACLYAGPERFAKLKILSRRN